MNDSEFNSVFDGISIDIDNRYVVIPLLEKSNENIIRHFENKNIVQLVTGINSSFTLKE